MKFDIEGRLPGLKKCISTTLHRKKEDSYKPEEICPYPPGARLWVWETWAKKIHTDNRYYYEVAKYKP